MTGILTVTNYIIRRCNVSQINHVTKTTLFDVAVLNLIKIHSLISYLNRWLQVWKLDAKKSIFYRFTFIVSNLVINLNMFFFIE